MWAVFYCPKCGEQANIDERLVGRDTVCPNCHFTFPTAAVRNSPPDPASANPFTFSEPDGDGEDGEIRPRYRENSGRSKLVGALVMVGVIVVVVPLVIVLQLSANAERKEANQQGKFSVSSMLMAGAAGAVVAVGVAVARVFMKPASRPKEPSRGRSGPSDRSRDRDRPVRRRDGPAQPTGDPRQDFDFS